MDLQGKTGGTEDSVSTLYISGCLCLPWSGRKDWTPISRWSTRPVGHVQVWCQSNKIWLVHFAMQNVVSEDDQPMCFKNVLLTKTEVFLQLYLMGVWHLKRKHCPFFPERRTQQLFILHKKGSVFCRGCEKRHPSHFDSTFAFRKDNQQKKKQQKYNNKALSHSGTQAFWSC